MGGISELPERVIHHIQSFLYTNEAAQTSTLCKTWYRAWLTCPTLDFGNLYLIPRFQSERGEDFFKFLKSTFQRYKEGKIPIVKLNLDISMMGFYPNAIVHEWIDISVQNGVEILKVNFDGRFDLPLFNPDIHILLRTIFEAKTLRELTIHRMKLEMDMEMKTKQQTGYKVMCDHLRKLHLFQVNIGGDEIFNEIIARCPLIEDLVVFNCCGFKRIKVTNLFYLKKLTVYFLDDRDNQYSVEIDAPHLEFLHCRLPNDASLDLNTTEKLKFLSFDGTLPSAAACFDNFMHKFAQVEDLRLANCVGLETISISSHALKRVTLVDMKDLRVVKIDAPSLRIISFTFYAYPIFFPDLSLDNVSSQCVLEICIRDPGEMDMYKLCKLKEFLVKLIPFKISLDIVVHLKSARLDNATQIPIFPAVQVEVLELWFGHETTLAHEDFLDALFLTCHPKTIRVHQGEENARFLYKYLMKIREDQDWCIITCHETKPPHWYQDLQQVRVEMYDETNHVWQPIDWENTQEAPHWSSRVRFKLSWNGEALTS